MKVKIFKVVIPSYLAWPPGNVILQISFLQDDAEKYIAAYPNVFLRTLMTVQSEDMDVHATD